MNREQAIESAKQIGVAPGDTITVQSEGQIEHPHDSGSGTHGCHPQPGWHLERREAASLLINDSSPAHLSDDDEPVSNYHFMEIIMEKAIDNNTNARYNDEIVFIDGIVDMHPEVLAAMSDEDRETLEVYYLVGQAVPENIFEYRSSLVEDNPGIQNRAMIVFNKLLAVLEVDNFKYTTKVPDSK